MRKLINLSLLGLALVMGCKEPKQIKIGHQCNWEDCELVGQTSFHSTWEYDEGELGYETEETHWQHPDWDYEKCEHFAMCGNAYYEHAKDCTCDYCMEWTDGHSRDYTLIQGLDSMIILDQDLDTISKHLIK